MKRKHDVFFGFAVMIIAAIFTLAGCGDSGSGDPTTPPGGDPNKVATPMATPRAGAVASGTSVVLVSSTSGATIYYTINGNTPTSSSTQYSSPIPITTATTIKAIAVKAGMTDSDILTAAYTISGGGGGSGGSSTGESFKSRYDEAMSAGRGSNFALEYAPSTHSLRTFTDRRFETYAYIDTYLLPYASSTHSLQTFEERFKQARNTKNYEYSLAYASSTHSLQTFNNRYDEAIGAGKIFEYNLAYASSTHSFQTFNNRYDEAVGAGNYAAYSRAYAKSRHSP